MDLAVRAGLKGWKFVFLGDLQVHSRLQFSFVNLFLYHALVDIHDLNILEAVHN